MMFGLSAIMFVGHSFALAAHYELFNHRTKRTYRYFPTQEKIVVVIVIFISFVYFGLWYAREST